MMKIGLIREGKIPVDKRVPLTPSQAKEVMDIFPGVKVFAQSSKIRCYTDDDYQQEGIEIRENVSDCDVLLGVKEVPIQELLPEKTYFFFSHTIKKQSYNRNLLRALIEKKIRMIDYETLTDSEGARVIAFGRYAGIVGAYNGLMAYGLRNKLFSLKPAHECFDMKELHEELKKVSLGPIKVVTTGGGRVTGGAIEILEAAGIKRVSPTDFVENTYETPVYTQLRSSDYHKRTSDGGFDSSEFYKKPELYASDFLKFAHVSEILVATAYWNPKAPVLFTTEDMKDKAFKIEVIADVTCDIMGSIPSTVRPSTIADPLYDFDPYSETEKPTFSHPQNITVMAVDNLPCELPRDASRDFGRQLIDNVLPNLLGEDSKNMIMNASICMKGDLTPKYEYLRDYLDGKE